MSTATATATEAAPAVAGSSAMTKTDVRRPSSSASTATTEDSSSLNSRSNSDGSKKAVDELEASVRSTPQPLPKTSISSLAATTTAATASRKKSYNRSTSLPERLFEGASTWMCQQSESLHRPTKRSLLDEDMFSASDEDDFNSNASDTESLSSVAYFEASDFAPANWSRTLEVLPPVGLAAVATGFACLHPVVFIAGALTAFGAVHVVGAGYDWWNHPGGSSSAADPEQTDLAKSIRTIMFCDEDTTTTTTATTKATLSSSDANGDQAIQLKNKKSPTGAVTSSIKQISIGEESTAIEQTSATRKNELDAQSEKDPATPATVATVEDTSLTMSTSASNNPAKTSGKTKEFASTLKTYEEISDWVNQHYPPLSNHAANNQKFHGLNAKEFFRVFFDDDAPYTYEEFQRRRQDKDICYENWSPITVSQPSMHASGKSVVPDISMKQRTLRFQAKTKSFFGPPYAKTTKQQRAYSPSKRLLIIESNTTVKEIPFCDKFCVMERWIVTAFRDPKTKIYESTLSVYSQAIFFTTSCPFESKIKSTSNGTISDIASSWCAMAHEALKLTEAKRHQRIQHEGLDDDDDDDDDTMRSIDDDEVIIPQQNEQQTVDDIEIQYDGGTIILNDDTPIVMEIPIIENDIPNIPKKRLLFKKSFSKMIPKMRRRSTPTMQQ